MTAREANFDGLVGPTHNYSGLSFGNVASIDSAGHPSNPRAAAHQGLDKMRLLAGFGLLQGILPPHERPNVHELRRQGFEGSDATVLRDVAARAPQLLNTMSSAAAMWAANAATVSPSIDTAGGRVHITPANLAFNQHRAIEAPITARLLHRVFASDQHFVVHEPLDAELRDEGAANHTRLALDHGAPGVELFTYGSGGAVGPRRFPGRQDLGASQAIAVAHGVQTYVLAQQHPAAVDAGVFHNDVIAVGNLTTLLIHEQAYHDQASVLRAVADLLDGELNVIEVTADELPIEEAVASYLFNSQLVSLGDRQLLLAPEEILRHERSAAVAHPFLISSDSSPKERSWPSGMKMGS